MQNQMRGIITGLADRDRSVLVTVNIGVPLVVELTGQAYSDMELRPGRPVWALFKAHALRRVAEWQHREPEPVHEAQTSTVSRADSGKQPTSGRCTLEAIESL